MINYGLAPADDEIEITLFGPGYGEAIAIHLGENQWMLVDSCIDPFSNEPASATYLQSIGVTPDRVLAIIASHWHDDHVRGISSLATRYAQAEFSISVVLNEREARAFLAAYGGGAAPAQTGGTAELFKVISTRDPVYFVLHRSNVLEVQASGRTVRVTAFSPLPAAVAQSVAHFAEYVAVDAGPIGHAPELKPNKEAVALHIDLGDDAILLGSDLEEHATHGWSAVAA